MPRTRIIIQSRLSSSRLPGKALLTVGPHPVAILAAKRAGRGGLDVVLATSTAPEDNAIARAAERADVTCFRGSLHDPLDRFAHASTDLAEDDVVVRLTADNVVPDSDFVQDLTDALSACGEDYIRVADGFPYGLGAEAFTVRMLRQAHDCATTTFDREHVTPWMRRQTSDHTWSPVAIPVYLRHLRCTIDTYDDYVIAEAAIASVSDAVASPWSELLLAWADAAGPHRPPMQGRDNLIDQGPWLLGTVQLGLAYGAANTTGLPDIETASILLRRAVAAGVTHLDTARAYGVSEARIGQSRSRGLSERVKVVTKIRPLDHIPHDAPATWTRDAVLASTERSLRELMASQVSGLLVHRWADWSRGGGGVADTLDDLRSTGVAEVIGASLSSPGELVEALADPRVGYVQLPFNVLDRRWTEESVVKALAARPEVVVTVRSVFLQGLLVSGDAAWPSNSGMDPEVVRDALSSLVTELGRESVADLCIAYVLGHPFVTSVVLGAETTDQVAQQADWLRRAPLTSAEIETVRARVPGGSAVVVDPSTWIMGS